MKMLPTLTTMDHFARKRRRPSLAATNRKTGYLSDTEGIIGGKLNPQWAEWFMGWPSEWTDLKPLETDKFRQWLDSHGAN